MIIYTDAPIAYDYGHTVELDPVAGRLVNNGNPVREVEITAETEDWTIYLTQYQCGRYASGLYIRLTQEEFDEWVDGEMIVRT